MGSREASVVAVVLILSCAMLFTEAGPRFFTQANIQNILRQTGLLAVFSVGETLVIITGGIDLSLGSLIAFSGMLVAMSVRFFSQWLEPAAAIPLAILVTLGVAFAIGCIHATLIHYLRLPPFVVTLASLLILRSNAAMMNDQLPITIEGFPALLWLANGTLFEGTPVPVPVPLAVLAVIGTAAAILLTRTRVGRYLYSVGSNEAATRLSGVNVYKVKLFAYGMSAVLGGLAGVMYASFGQQGDPRAGAAYELDAVAASVVGGASLAGGQGSALGACLGALLLHLIFSAINLTLARPDIWRGTVVGGVLLFAVLVTALQQRRSS
ncbi:MAG TPA: ABC transporter permease [Chthonomonadales bacterium]|nr:ABC transporter permease [Chthonomonadales bacterium]